MEEYKTIQDRLDTKHSLTLSETLRVSIASILAKSGKGVYSKWRLDMLDRLKETIKEGALTLFDLNRKRRKRVVKQLTLFERNRSQNKGK